MSSSVHLKSEFLNGTVINLLSLRDLRFQDKNSQIKIENKFNLEKQIFVIFKKNVWSRGVHALSSAKI